MPQKMVNGELVEISVEEARRVQSFWEFRRRPEDGTPERRKVSGYDGAVLIPWEQDPDEEVREVEADEAREDARSVLTDRLSALATTPAGQRRIDVWVAGGVVTARDALDAGWEPPSERGR